jgi:hypothetical protein
MSNGNLREALNLAQFCYSNANKHTTPPMFVYFKDTMIKTLYGTPSAFKESDVDTESSRNLINILRSIEIGDPVPFMYVALSCLHLPRIVDENFVKQFNEEIRQLNPKETPDMSLNINKVIYIIAECHKKALIRRTEHVDLKAIPDNADSYNHQQTVLNHKWCLTEKGSFLLNLASTNDLYQKLTALDSWRTGVSSKIKERKFNILTPPPTYIYD